MHGFEVSQVGLESAVECTRYPSLKGPDDTRA